MGTGASSGSAAHIERAAGMFPVCLTAVALAALSPTLSILARASLLVASSAAANLPREAAGVEFSDEQLGEGVGGCMVPEADLSE